MSCLIQTATSSKFNLIKQQYYIQLRSRLRRHTTCVYEKRNQPQSCHPRRLNNGLVLVHVVYGDDRYVAAASAAAAAAAAAVLMSVLQRQLD